MSEHIQGKLGIDLASCLSLRTVSSYNDADEHGIQNITETELKLTFHYVAVLQCIVVPGCRVSKPF